MPSDKPSRPQANPIRTSFVDGGWEDPPPLADPRESVESITEVDDLLEDAPAPPLGNLPPVPLPPPRMPPPPAPPVIREAPPPAQPLFLAPEPEPPPAPAPAPARAGVPPVLLAVTGAFAIALAAVAFFVGRAGRAPAPPVAVASAPVPVAPPPPSAAPAPPPIPTTEIAKAASGDKDALAAIEQRDPGARSVDESLAVAAGHLAVERHALDALVAELGKDPSKIADRAVRAELVRFAREPLTFEAAQRAIAALPGPDGPDLLYEVWTGTPRHTDATELAEALVLAKGVREHASPALALALDLRAPASCEDAKKLVDAAPETGDRRAVHLLLRLESKRGCGAGKRDDCYPCLRADRDAITNAVKAVRQKPGPRF